MNRARLNLVVDLLAALCMLMMVATGYILRFPLPPTTNRTHELWGMSRHEWGSIHGWASLALLAVIVTHVVLHWEWLYAMIRRRFTAVKAVPGQRIVAGLLTVLGLAIIAGLFAWATHAGVRKMEKPVHSLPESNEPVASMLESVVLIREVDFQRDVMPIFEDACIGCHGPRKQRAGFRVDGRENFFAPDDVAPLIVPGHPEKSRLMAIVSGEVKDMKSAEDHFLPPEELAVLRAWIEAGAIWREK